MTLTRNVPQTYPLDSYLTTINELLSSRTPDLILGEQNQSSEVQRTFQAKLRDVSQESEEYLQLKGALRIVPIELRNKLLGAYIKYVHPLLPIIDLQWFLLNVMVEDETRFVSPLLYQAVMLAGSAFIEQETAISAGFSSRKALRRTLFGRAKVSLSEKNMVHGKFKAVLIFIASFSMNLRPNPTPISKSKHCC